MADKIRKRAPRRYTETLVIRLEAGDVERLDAVAKAIRLPRAILIRNLIVERLEAHERQQVADRIPLTAEERTILADFRDRYPIARRA
jgi:predicted DNA-binding protein